MRLLFYNSEPMKKLSLLFILIISIAFFSCDPAEQYAISFKINGTTPWYSSSAPCFYNSGKIYLNAVSTNPSQYILAWVFDTENPGTYPIDHVVNHLSYGDTITGYYAQSSNPASLTVTEFNTTNKKFVGTFYGKLYNAAKTDSILITDGRFNLVYQ